MKVGTRHGWLQDWLLKCKTAISDDQSQTHGRTIRVCRGRVQKSRWTGKREEDPTFDRWQCELGGSNGKKRLQAIRSTPTILLALSLDG